MKKLTGNTEIEDSLAKLDKLTQEEARMASAELLKVTHSVDGKVTNIDNRVKNVEGNVQDVRGDVQGVGNKVQGVDDRVQGIDSEIRGVNDKLDNANRSLFLSYLIVPSAQKRSQGTTSETVF
jgi:peptidoglycan hydrolase CwlO-like protein